MSLEFDIRKLEPKRGDTIIVRYPADLDQKQVTKVFHVCGLMMDQTGVLVVAVPKSIDITVDSNYLKAAQPHLPRTIMGLPVVVDESIPKMTQENPPIIVGKPGLKVKK